MRGGVFTINIFFQFAYKYLLIVLFYSIVYGVTRPCGGLQRGVEFRGRFKFQVFARCLNEYIPRGNVSENGTIKQRKEDVTHRFNGLPSYARSAVSIFVSRLFQMNSPGPRATGFRTAVTVTP